MCRLTMPQVHSPLFNKPLYQFVVMHPTFIRRGIIVPSLFNPATTFYVFLYLDPGDRRVEQIR